MKLQYRKNYWFCEGVNIYGEDSVLRVLIDKISNVDGLIKIIKKILEELREKDKVFLEKRKLFTFIVFTVSRVRIGKIIFETALAVVNREKTLDDNLISFLKKEHYKQSLNASAQILYQRAKELTIPVWRFNDKHLLVLGTGKYRQFLRGSRSSFVSSVGTTIADKKFITREVLIKSGLPMAPGGIVESFNQAFRLSKKVGYPLVLKPEGGRHGTGVKVGIKDSRELRKIWEEVGLTAKKFILEKQVFGEDLRILVVDYKFIAASKRLPANVVGDGKSTIYKLIEKENKNPNRGFGHSRPLTKIKIDKEMERVLEGQGLDLKSVPLLGKRIFLRRTANLSTGGEGWNVTDKVCPENIALFERVARMADLRTVGIDVITTDIGKPLDKTGGVILELNSSPGLRMHHFPSKGKPCDAAGKIFKMLFPDDKTRIPIIAVTGTNGKTTVVRLLANILQKKFKKVGWTVNDGGFINNKLVFGYIGGGSSGARAILQDNQVEVAILETTQNTIWSLGLGFDGADVSVITNITADHVETIYGDTLLDIKKNKSLIIKQTLNNGRLVLNAKDPFLIDLEKENKVEVYWFSLKPESQRVKDLLKKKATVFGLKSDWLVKLGTREEKIVEVRKIPLTFKKKAAFNIANCLAVVAAVWENKRFGLTKKDIIEGLKDFV